MSIIPPDMDHLFPEQVRAAEAAFNAFVIDRGHQDATILCYTRMGTSNRAALEKMAAKAAEAGWNVRLYLTAEDPVEERGVYLVQVCRQRLPEEDDNFCKNFPSRRA